MKAFIASVAVLATLLSGCANPCGDLKTQCDKCTASTGKTTCLAAYTLTLNNPTSCQAILDAKTYAADGVACK